MKHFVRTENNLTPEVYQKIQNKSVMIAGLGGVGSYALESIARLGINNLTICDFDVVDESNINRQLVALKSTIGQKKVLIAEKRLRDINPKVSLRIFDEKIASDTIEEVFSAPLDFVIDAIDDIPAKLLIIKMCLKKNIPFISVMGTANKLNPQGFAITEIKKTTYDPIARIIRRKLKDEAIFDKVMVICSKEMPLQREGLSSNSFVPATAGLLSTSYALQKLMEECK